MGPQERYQEGEGMTRVYCIGDECKHRVKDHLDRNVCSLEDIGVTINIEKNGDIYFDCDAWSSD